MSPERVDVFPINSAAFGIRPDWFEAFTGQFDQPAYMLLSLLLIVSIGLMALRRFEDANFERKLWGIPVILLAIFVWPSLVLGLKSMVDTFNTFLVVSVFRIPWRGFGFPDVGSAANLIGWSAEGFARLLPNLSYWIIYTFYMVFMFFYSVLGPFVIAKGILKDEVETFLELVGEVALLLLWQTTMVILVAFIMPGIVSGTDFPANSDIYFLSLILGIMLLFVPSLTRKFVTSVSSSFMPLGFRWGGAFVGLTLAARAGGALMGALGMSSGARHSMHTMFHHAAEGEEFGARYRHRQHAHHLEHEVHGLHEQNHHLQHEVEHAHGHGHEGGHDSGHGEEHGHGDGHNEHGHGHDDHGGGHGQDLWSLATHAKHDSDNHH